MVQPQYSPEEALNKIKLMMGYDLSKTLKENVSETKGLIKESSIDDYWKTLDPVTKNKFATLNGAAGVFGTMGTDEEMFVKGVKSLTKQDLIKLEDLMSKVGMAGYRSFTSMVNGEFGKDDLQYVKDIVLHLASLGYKPSYKELYGGFVEDSFELGGGSSQSNDNNNSGGGGTSAGNKRKKPGIKRKYIACAGTTEQPFKELCYEKDPNGPLHKVQSCLGLTADGKFWKKTSEALLSKTGKNTFTINDVEAICKLSSGTKPPVKDIQEPEISGEDIYTDPSNTNF